jgi:translation initiation factor 5B
MVHLKKENIAVSGVHVGPVRKQDVTRACAMLEKDNGDFLERECASILAFDVKVDSVVLEYAEDTGVRIFAEPVIYGLADAYLAYAVESKAERKRKAQSL